MYILFVNYFIKDLSGDFERNGDTDELTLKHL